jgi:hypothetical protein
MEGKIRLNISDDVLTKLKNKHNVIRSEVIECFNNKTRSSLVDDREEHKTAPPTEWFIGSTDQDRELKVVFIYYRDEYMIDLKSAYEPSDNAKKIYAAKSLPLGT